MNSKTESRSVKYRSLALANTEDLLELMKQMTDAELSFAAEALSYSIDDKIVIPTLIKLLNHEKSVVREGAALGSFSRVNNSKVKLALKKAAKKETSSGVKSVINDILEWENLE